MPGTVSHTRLALSPIVYLALDYSFSFARRLSHPIMAKICQAIHYSVTLSISKLRHTWPPRYRKLRPPNFSLPHHPSPSSRPAVPTLHAPLLLRTTGTSFISGAHSSRFLPPIPLVAAPPSSFLPHVPYTYLLDFLHTSPKVALPLISSFRRQHLAFPLFVFHPIQLVFSPHITAPSRRLLSLLVLRWRRYRPSTPRCPPALPFATSLPLARLPPNQTHHLHHRHGLRPQKGEDNSSFKA